MSQGGRFRDPILLRTGVNDSASVIRFPLLEIGHSVLIAKWLR